MIRSPAPLRPLTRAQLVATLVLAAVVAALDVRLLPDDVSGAWFFILVGAIWGALQTAWQVSSTAISWAFRNILLGLRWTITNLGKVVSSGLAKAAIYTSKVLGIVWRGVRYIFEGVVRWMSKALDVVTGFLRRVFTPIIDWLVRAREWITRIYERYVRPILDVINVVRQIFRVLAALGIDWARAIDRALGRITAVIQFPFQFIIGKINELIGLINRIVTLDGLLQRLVLLRSLIRDVAYVNRLFYNSQTVELTPGELAAISEKHALIPPGEVERQGLAAIVNDSGPVAASVREYALIFEAELATPLGATRDPQ